MNMLKEDAYKVVMALATKKGYSSMIVGGPMNSIINDLYSMGMHLGAQDGHPTVENLKAKGFIRQDPNLPS